jgi:hypothetical protein
MTVLARLVSLACALSLTGICTGQTPKPVFTYSLHAHKARRTGFTLAPTLTLPSTVFLLAPDNSLVALIPQADGEWVLKRLTDWNTPAPREQTLAITGQKVGEEQVSVTTDVTVSPNATSLIVRLMYRRVVFGSNKRPVPEAVIVLVDLKQFTIISKRITSDALLATSQWHFAGNRVIVAKLLLTASPAHLPDRPSATSTYEAATLGFPDLNTNDSCRYNETMSCDGTNGCSAEINKQANSNCANLLQNTSASNLSDLLGDDTRESIATLAARDCMISATNNAKTLALFECRTGHAYLDGEIYITKSRTSMVRTVPEGKPVLTIPLPHNFHEIPGVLAANNGTEYLLLLRDGITLEGYRLLVSP